MKVVRRLSVEDEGLVLTESCSVERCGVQTSMAVSGRRPCSRRRRKGMAACAGGMEVFKTLSHGIAFQNEFKTTTTEANDRKANARASVNNFDA